MPDAPRPIARRPAGRPLTLPWLVLGGMLLQSLTGLVQPGLYRDAAWIVTTWYGNDWVTAALVCPLLLAALTGARPCRPRWQLLRLGLVGYGVYNYAFYMLGAALNPAFLLYILLFVLSVVLLVSELAAERVNALALHFPARTPRRLLSAYLMLVAIGLGAVWVGMWALHVFAGRPAPGSPEVFRLVAALDLAFMVPALLLAGVLLWRERPLGLALSALASVQAALYLLVLSVNSVLMIQRGLANWPGELVIWAPLCAMTTVAALLLLSHAEADRGD